MKVAWKDAVAFFTAVGFGKSKNWSQDKMRKYLTDTPERIAEENVDEEHLEFYKQLKAAGGKFELTGAPEAEEETTAPVKKDKMKKKEAAKKAKTKKPAKSKKPARKVDWLGMGVDTIRGKVNAQVTKEWVPEDEIVKGSGVKRKQAQLRLRQAVKAKQFERRRRTEYRILPSAAAKAK